MAHTYCVCDSCFKMNRVSLGTGREPICGHCKSKLPIHGAVVESNDRSLKALIDKSPIPVVLDVWAPWCGPCRAFAPTFSEVSEQRAGEAVFIKLNSDQNQHMPSSLGVRGIPTLVVFKNGQEADRISGALPAEQFNKWLSQAIGR